MTLPPMDSVEACVKCSYSTRPNLWPIEYVVRNQQRNAAGDVILLEDALRRTCPRCSYMWKERCQDA